MKVFYKLTMYDNGLPSYCYPPDSPIENVVIKKGNLVVSMEKGNRIKLAIH